MKYVIVITEGAADVPDEQRDGRTPLEAAAMPHAADLARAGHVGLAAMTPEGLDPTMRVSLLSLLGLNPERYGAWGEAKGATSPLPAFQERFGLRGAIATLSDEAAGLASMVGWDRLDVGAHRRGGETDDRAIGRAAVAAIKKHDLVCCFVESPGAASEQGDWDGKVAALEGIDRDLIGPVATRLARFGDPGEEAGAEGWRMLVMPLRSALVSTRTYDPMPVPFLLAGSWVRSAVERPFTEAGGVGSDLRITRGEELVEYFLRGGLAHVPKGAPARG